MARERTFGLPSLAIFAAVEPPLHLAAVLGLGPFATLGPLVDGDDGGANAQFLTAQAMIRFAIIGGIPEHTVPRNKDAGTFHGRSKLRTIIAGTGAHGGRGEEVAGGVADDRQLRPQACRVPFTGTGEVVAGGVPTLQARGINGRLGLRADEAAFLGAHGGRDEEKHGFPFFSSRCRALQRVE